MSPAIGRYLQDRYSGRAISQLAAITIHSGEVLNLRCPYQAKVMNTLLAISSRIGTTWLETVAAGMGDAGNRGEPMLAGRVPRSVAVPGRLHLASTLALAQSSRL
jgi:hypothetical protein